MTKDIWAPTFGDSVKIGQQTNSFSISISDELLKTMKLSSVRDMFFFLEVALLILHF